MIIELKSCDQKIPAIKAIRSAFGYGLKDAKDIMDSIPCTMKIKGNKVSMIDGTLSQKIKTPSDFCYILRDAGIIVREEEGQEKELQASIKEAMVLALEIDKFDILRDLIDIHQKL